MRLAYDYSHFVFTDLTMPATLRDLLPHTVFVAIKDAAVVDGKVGFRLPGETGAIDYAALLRQLAAAGYRGDVNCEVSAQLFNQPGFDGVAAARTCYKNVAPAFAAAAVERPART